jgi:hypothetical protein
MTNMLSIWNASAMSMPESARLGWVRRFTPGFALGASFLSFVLEMMRIPLFNI